MRQRFDANKDVKDMRVAKELVEQGEEEAFLNQHYQPRKCKCHSLNSSASWKERGNISHIVSIFMTNLII